MSQAELLAQYMKQNELLLNQLEAQQTQSAQEQIIQQTQLQAQQSKPTSKPTPVLSYPTPYPTQQPTSPPVNTLASKSNEELRVTLSFLPPSRVVRIFAVLCMCVCVCMSWRFAPTSMCTLCSDLRGLRHDQGKFCIPDRGELVTARSSTSA